MALNKYTHRISFFLAEAALKAAYIALMRKKNGLTVMNKECGSEAGSGTVTNGDLQSEQVIVAELRRAIPDIIRTLNLGAEIPFFFIAEESGLNDYSHRIKGYCFVIDPIDGTLNYTGKSPEPNPWCISIGLEKDGRTIAAAVYEAGYDEYAPGRENRIDHAHPCGTLYWADAEHGAYRLDARLSPICLSLASGANAEYEETTSHLLAAIPPLTVECDRTRCQRLTAHIPTLPLAKVELDGFMPDIEESDRVGDESLKYNGRVISHAQQAIMRCGYETHLNYSNVSGGLAAADGRAAGYICGRGQAWDHSAIRLILAESGAHVAEYDAAGYEGKRSIIVASKDRILFTHALAALREIGVIP